MVFLNGFFCRILASILIVSVFATISWPAQPALGEEILIGINLPITGGSASEMPYVRKAARLAEKQINQAGGIHGKKIRLVEEDNQSSNPGALAALTKSVEQDKALVVIGPLKSTMVQAIDRAIREFGVPVAIGATNAMLTKKGNPWLLRCRPDDSIAAFAMVKYVKEEMKLTKIGILHDTDAFGTGGADLIEQYARDLGVTVVKREKYTTKDKDFTAQLLSLKKAGAEVMCLYGTNFEDAAIIQRQYRELGLPYKYMGSPSSGSKDTLNLSRESAEGLIAIADYVPGSSEVSKKYAEAYKKEYNENMDALFAWNYDALNIFAGAIRKAGENRVEIMKAILATRDYKGVLGTYSFNAGGDGLHEVSVVKIEKGTHKLLRAIRAPGR